MGEKLIAFLTPISHLFQKGTASLSAVMGGVASFWLIFCVISVVIIIAIFALDKPKALSMLLIIYMLGFIAMLIPAVSKWLSVGLSSHDYYYAKTALGALPIVALIVLKYKKRR